MSDSESTFSYAIDPDARLAVGRMWGRVTGADMLALLRAVHTDPQWKDGFDALWDCSCVRAHIVFPDDVAPIIAEETRSGDGRDVLVESPAVGESEFSQMLAALSRRRGKAMTVHATIAEALQALGRAALPHALTQEQA